MHRLILSSLACLLFVPSALAQSAPPGGSLATKAEMVSEVKTVAAGETFTVALKLEHPARWHSYYKNSGGIEQSPAIQWVLPEGFSAGPIQWPVPEVKDGFFGKSFVHSGAPVFLVDLKAPADLKSGKTITLTANASWQICEESCMNEERSFTLTLSSGTALEKDPTVAELFEKARASQAQTAAGWKFSALSEGGDITLCVTPDKISDLAPVDFIPNQPFVLPASAGGSIQKDGADWRITLKRAVKDALEADIPQGKSFSGILTGPRAIAVPDTMISAPVAAGTTGASPKPATADPQRVQISFAEFLPILGGMFLGGLILNLMPCVFPVIGLKIMGFVQQAGHDRKKIVLHGLIFTLGVLISFWLLSLILFLGGITNWGNQLQDPRIILGTIVVMLLLGMNMFGVFEIGTSVTGVGGGLIRKQGMAGTFFSGVLATLIATPCTGPFLGIAIGVAVKLPAIPFFIAFTVMALGLALPYLVLSMFPALVEKLPRPGPWMESFKQGMSFLLFTTAGIFLWVYSDQVFDQNSGQKGLWVMIGLCAVATAGWIYGRWNQPVRKTSVRWIAKGLAAAFCTGGILMAWPWPDQTPVTDGKSPVAHSAGHAMTWGVWSQEEQDRLLAEGRPVFVDFTAKWCLTCQLNKSRAYTGPVVDLIKAKGIVALKADKTRSNPAIEAALSKLGRTAIPVNVLIVPGKDPVITPALLSPEYLLELFSTVADPVAKP
jgi:thiol:disulfide interchange protein DsbD